MATKTFWKGVPGFQNRKEIYFIYIFIFIYMYIYVCTENEFLIMQEEKIHTRRYGNILDILKENKMALMDL